ncbi:MAG: DUF2510 domain-containing protein [Salinibacterium sp.]|nr:MAG: DUF2510 domain-containing protein [Salinibacterium sp.]
MTNATTPSVPPGWYLDPAGSQRNRWWDGFNWTDHFQDSYSVTEVLKAPEGTKVGTAWIWIIALAPLVSMLSLLLVDWGSYFNGLMADPSSSMRAEMAFLTSPGYLTAVLGGWALWGLTIWFAYLDWRALKLAGVPRPFHFAWVILANSVYVIGRAVVANRRTGRGLGMMWVAIAVIVTIFIFEFVWVGWMMTEMMSSFSQNYSSY